MHPGSLKNSRENEEAEFGGELPQMMLEGWVGSVCHRAVSRGGLRSCASYFTIISSWLNCTSVFCFLLFLFVMWCHLGHPCLSTLQENTWCHIQSCHPQPSCHLQDETSMRSPLAHFEVLSFQPPELHSVWQSNKHCLSPYSASRWHLGSWLCCLKETF